MLAETIHWHRTAEELPEAIPSQCSCCLDTARRVLFIAHWEDSYTGYFDKMAGKTGVFKSDMDDQEYAPSSVPYWAYPPVGPTAKTEVPAMTQLFTVTVDSWGEDDNGKPLPKPDGHHPPIAYEGESAEMAGTVYSACCLALKFGGCYRSNKGVFFFRNGKLTDRYLIRDGQVLPRHEREVPA